MPPLDDYRTEIDRIDREILALLQERQTFAGKIGEAKKATGAAFYAPSREAALISKLESHASEILPKAAIRAIYREIISLSIGTQMEKPVAYLGPEGTYTQQATLKNFGSSVPLKALRTIGDIFAAVERDEASNGVIPIENSTEGAIVHSMDMLAETELKVVAQITLDIEHCLLGNGAISNVKKVLSKDIALAQCRNWLQRNLPNAELIPTDSTAAAVKKTLLENDTAAVASALASTLYEVPILASGIQDKLNNITRFLVLGKKPNPPSADCQYKTSVVISLRNAPGTLQKALAPISKHGLNLSRIESRPNRKKAWEYLFFLDFIGHWEAPEVQATIAELKESCTLVKWLGSYPNEN